MISAFFIFNHKGDTIIYRQYRDDISRRAAADAFRVHVISSRSVIRSPVHTIGGTSFFHRKVNNVWFLCVTRQNANAAMIFELLNSFVDVTQSYLHNITQERIKENFATMYELLDEAVDFGYPQHTGADILKLCITQGGFTPQEQTMIANQLTAQVTGAVSWRREGIRYRKNEIFIDIIENVNVLVATDQRVLTSNVSGSIMLRCYLSGMPECKFGLNDKVLMDPEVVAAAQAAGVPLPKQKGKKQIAIDDYTFHQCVKLGKFSSDRTISFVPVDGEFELMRYRITQNIHIPFKIVPLVKEIGKTRLEITVVLKSLYVTRLLATNVEVRIPTPPNTSKANVTCLAGRAKYKSGENAIIWKIKRMSGQTELQINADIELLSMAKGAKNWSRPPVSLKFQVPMFTASGLNVRFCKVFEPKLAYKTIKWVRYLTQAGTYELRI
eukprot:Clim_evm70s149 gene=Clim_evmTU70s149